MTFMASMQHQASDHKGKYISIGIPLIPYVSGAAINNAQIQVTDRKEGTLEALDTSPSPDGDHAPNGSVSITEYSQNVLIGTFNASLVRPRDMIQTQSGTELTVVDRISGSFTISAPWRGNAAPSAEPDGPMMEGIRDDLIGMLQSLPPQARSSLIGGAQRAALCQILTSQDLTNLGIPGGCSSGSGPGSVVEATCHCTCVTYEAERHTGACRRQCEPEWIENQCYGSAITDAGPKDSETLRFEADLRQHSQSGLFQVQENAIEPVVFIFQTATPEQRSEMWAELEQNKQAAVDYQREQEEQALQPPSAMEANYDAETLRYQEAVKALGLPPDLVEDLVEMFHSNEAAFREVLWQRVNESPLNQ